ncbi:MAG: ATP-binding cassette domain-containing protein [Bdellovibrionales bacterium]|nr:ATP-binding cassette domain-containing protein [Bdellovibrionales bacterium]
MEEIVIELEAVSRRYGAFTAVDAVSFTVPRGQILGLLGHNGAGKTTILKMLTGYLEPSLGTVRVAGLDMVAERLSAQAKIGYLPENCPLYPEMVVIDYLSHIASLRAVPIAAQAKLIRRALERVGLIEKATAPIATLSKGLRQRVGIAQAILQDPEILVLDEPTSGLDPEQIHEIRALIRTLSKQATVILSTHILQEVQAMCERVVIMMHGKVAADAEIAELRRSNRIILTVRTADTAAVDRLRRLDGVTSVSEQPAVSVALGERQFRIEVSAANAPGVSPALARAVVESGWELIALHPEYRDLDAIFRELSEAKRGQA